MWPRNHGTGCLTSIYAHKAVLQAALDTYLHLACCFPKRNFFQVHLDALLMATLFLLQSSRNFFSCPSKNAESGSIWVAVRLLATYILEGMIYSITTTALSGFSTATSPHLDDRWFWKHNMMAVVSLAAPPLSQLGSTWSRYGVSLQWQHSWNLSLSTSKTVNFFR
jgi:hypothetical protein